MDYKTRYFVSGIEVPWGDGVRLVHLRKIGLGSHSVVLSDIPNIKTYTKGTKIISELDKTDPLLREGLELANLELKYTLIITKWPDQESPSDPLADRRYAYIFDCREY